VILAGKPAIKDNTMTKTLEVKVLSKCARDEKIKKGELLRLMKALDTRARSQRVIKGSRKITTAVPGKMASGTRLSRATLGLLRQYFAICIALKREYTGIEGV